MPRLERSALTPPLNPCRCTHREPEGVMDLTARRVASFVVGLIVAIFSAEAIGPLVGLLLGAASAFLWHQITSGPSCDGTCRRAIPVLPQEGGRWEARETRFLNSPDRSQRTPWSWQGPPAPSLYSAQFPVSLGDQPFSASYSAPPPPAQPPAFGHVGVGRGHEPAGYSAPLPLARPPAFGHVGVGQGHEPARYSAPLPPVQPPTFGRVGVGQGHEPAGYSAPPPSAQPPTFGHVGVGQGHERSVAAPIGDRVGVGERR